MKLKVMQFSRFFYCAIGLSSNYSPRHYFQALCYFQVSSCMYVCICRGGFPHALRPYMDYCTSPMDIQTAAMPTHRASPLVPPSREQRN
jgi:hypothetical protein